MRKIGLLFVCLLSCVAVWAQSLEIKKEFTKEPYSSVLVKFANEFREHEMPDMAPGERFPYAAICVNLEGDGGEVAAAKRTLSVEMGMAKVQERVTDKDNMLLFLVSSSAARVSLTCGDGCSKVRILDLPCLESNAVYSGTVHFVPYQEKNVTQAPQRQFFKFRVTPKKDAWVTVWENGEQQTLTLDEEGMTRKMFNYGTYRYMVSADRYHSQEGMFTVSKTPGELAVTLQPQFGWLTIEGDAVANGAHVFATNTATGRKTQLGTIPLTDREIDEGVYALQIQQAKYKDYSTTVTISEGKTTVIRPQLEANFAELTLTTQSGADIYVDGRKLGTGRWSGTLELGEYSVETRQASHKSSYTNLAVSLQTAGQTIELNDPLPIYGSLIVDGTPMDVAVYVDNKKVGVSPLVYSEILIGEHKVRLEKEGYAKQEKTVQIAEGQEHMLDYTLAKETPKPTLTDKETFTVNGVSFTMVAVKGGTFTMGGTAEQGSDAYDWEKPTHQVTLSDYMIGETEVTQELWLNVMGSNPSHSSGTNKPVEEVSWNDCQTFITRLNELTGMNFRLPTEAEWEYAARGGNKSKGYKYAGSNTLSDVAWYNDYSSSIGIHPVKQKQANELGLYDMSGNVFEWCQDWYGNYNSSAQTNPTGPASGSKRVSRGGSWSYTDCHVSYRNYYTPENTRSDLGLRLVLSGHGQISSYKEEIGINRAGGHEYVDLGLSVKWATCNVGANKPEDYGDYFAWGETKPKSTYSWSTYKWCRGIRESQIKYCTSSDYGTVDNKRTLDLSDDAARANWGGSWRMPTEAEQDELREKCTWTWTTQNGVKGYIVTSKSNGNSIFLPAAGIRYASSIDNAGSIGYYWSSAFARVIPSLAFLLMLDSSRVYSNQNDRYCGQSVRPVCP